jgi:hypothetical protein
VLVLIFSRISVLSSPLPESLRLLSNRVNRKPRWPLGGGSAAVTSHEQWDDWFREVRFELGIGDGDIEGLMDIFPPVN